MKNVFADAKIELACPHCAHKFSETIGKLQTNPHLTCGSCRQGFDIDASQLRAAVEKLSKSLAKLNATARRLGK